ncbi:MAG: hypothetical protein KKB50_15850 [Planctomycetes bacterium]|nr:hypothetical protein [Planctomycetota bacterium]
MQQEGNEHTHVESPDTRIRHERRRFLHLFAVTLGAACVEPFLSGCRDERDVLQLSQSKEPNAARHGRVHFEGCRLLADGLLVGEIAPLGLSGFECNDELRDLGDGVFEWQRTVTLRAEAGAQPARVTLDFAAAHASTFSLIPAISYNGNQWGGGREPKGFSHDGEPWSFAFHRGAVPGGTYSEGPKWAVALWAKEATPARGGSCSLVPTANCTTHRLIWPEEERPLTYSGRDEYDRPYAENMTLRHGESFTATAYLLVAPVRQPKTAWRRWIDACWTRTQQNRPARYSPEELRGHGVHFARERLWAEEAEFRGFSIGLLQSGHEWHQRTRHKYEIGWAGQNASLACALLDDFLRTGEKASLDKGLAALDTWVRHGRFPCGLVYAVIDPVLDGSQPGQLDACNMGNAAEFFLEAYELAQRCGVSKPEYRELALGICDFMLKHQQPDGRFGRAWTSTGECLSPDGTIGCFIVPALIAAFRATNRREYLESAARGYRAYHGGLTEHGFATAGALDTDCIDKESAWPLIDAGLALYDITGDSLYLNATEAAAYYTATWQYCHSVPVQPNSMFADMEYDSFGGTAVSTQHHHVDPYGVRFVPGYLRLARLTGNRMWEKRARALWYNGMLGVSDGTLKLRGVELPRGGQCEGYFQTRWGSQGNCSLWLVAWPTAFRLEVLRRMGDWTRLSDPGSGLGS